MGNKLPDGVSVDKLRSNYSVAKSEYSKAFNRAEKLDMADRNKLWASINAKFPVYQVLPETNHVAYIKNNILASIYTVGKSASLLPTSEDDKDIVTQLNIAIEHIWSQLNVSYYQMMAGERAALLNLGITQVGWDNGFVSGKVGSDAFEKGRCKLKNVNPLHYMRDPFSTNLENAAYVMTWDEYHKSVILANSNYKAEFEKFLASKESGLGASTIVLDKASDRVSPSSGGRNDYFTIVIHWIRDGAKIHEIHTVNNEYVLYVKEDIKPSIFPFAELYCNLPNGDLIGVSEANKIFANSLAYNIMHSIILTAEYKNQRPPKFVNNQSNINLSSFIKHGNEADRTFLVQGDASKAVHYQQFPQPSAAAITTMSVLANDIKNVTGVDDRYTGRDTGSILTTGGINNMLDQVTMVDAPKIINYEDYCKRLTKLIIGNYIQFSALERKYLTRDKNNPKAWKTVTVDFPSIDKEAVFDYEIMISSELPKNKTIVANMANKLMEMQMQYGSANISADLITPQEWIMFQQDLPFKEYMLERMNVQRTESWSEAVAQIVTQYGNLVQNGADPQDAINATAQTMASQATDQGGAEDVAAQLMQGGGLF